MKKYMNSWIFALCLLVVTVAASTAVAQEGAEGPADEDATMEGETMERTTVGGFLGYDIEVEEPFLGAEGRFTFDVAPDMAISANPVLSYYLLFGEDYRDSGDDWSYSFTAFQIDLNGLFHYRIDGPVDVYGGLGLAFFHMRSSSEYVDWQGEEQSDSDSRTEVGLNLIGGAEFDLDMPVTPFAQFRLSTAASGVPGMSNAFSLMAGVVYRL